MKIFVTTFRVMIGVEILTELLTPQEVLSSSSEAFHQFTSQRIDYNPLTFNFMRRIAVFFLGFEVAKHRILILFDNNTTAK